MSSPANRPLVSYQPAKAVFQLAYISSIIIRLPVWLVKSLIPFLRPYPRWTFKQTLMSRISYAVVDMQSRCGTTETLLTQPATEGNRFHIVKPFDSAYYQVVLDHADTKPAPVGGTWFPQAPGQHTATKTVVLYLHGGAFVQGDGRQNFCKFVGATLIEYGNVDYLFSVQYRLAGYGLNPFPAAVQDALTAYIFLLTTARIEPERIVLAGDSAGGNLAIALLRYIQEYGKELNIPLPKCCVLFSPWYVLTFHPTYLRIDLSVPSLWSLSLTPAMFLGRRPMISTLLRILISALIGFPRLFCVGVLRFTAPAWRSPSRTHTSRRSATRSERTCQFLSTRGPSKYSIRI